MFETSSYFMFSFCTDCSYISLINSHLSHTPFAAFLCMADDDLDDTSPYRALAAL